MVFKIKANIRFLENVMFLPCKYGPGTQGPGTILSSKVVRMGNKQNTCAKVGARGIKKFSKLTILVPF